MGPIVGPFLLLVFVKVVFFVAGAEFWCFVCLLNCFLRVSHLLLSFGLLAGIACCGKFVLPFLHLAQGEFFCVFTRCRRFLLQFGDKQIVSGQIQNVSFFWCAPSFFVWILLLVWAIFLLPIDICLAKNYTYSIPQKGVSL